MISSELKVVLQKDKHGAGERIAAAHPEYLVATGSHGCVVFSRKTGMRLMSTSCDCPDGPDCYDVILKADLEEHSQWHPGTEGTVDILGLGYTKINGQVVKPAYEWRELIEGFRI